MDEITLKFVDSVEFSPRGIHIHSGTQTVVIEWPLWREIEQEYEEQDDF